MLVCFVAGSASANIPHKIRKTFYLPGPRGAHLGSKLGSMLVCFGAGSASANIPRCVKMFFSPTRSKGCSFRFQVGFHVGKKISYHSVVCLQRPSPSETNQQGTQLGT